MKVERSAGAIIFREEEDKIFYLLLNWPTEKSGHWDFPKGYIEKGEKTLDAVRREVGEESGIGDLEFIDGFKETIKYIYTWPPKDKNAERRMKFVVFFLAKTKTKKVQLSYEHKDYAWLIYEDALKKLTYSSAKGLLKKADNFLHTNDCK